MTHKIIPVVNYSFPAARFVKTAKITEQMKHVTSEMFKVLTAVSFLQELEEAIDLYHSLETYFRILERDGIDVFGAFREVYDKNKARGYYENLDTQTTEPETNAKD